MAEKMTNEREAFEKWASEYGFTKFDKTSTGAYKTFVSRALFDSFRAGVNHLAQPAQAVDVGAIREVIDRLRINPSITAQECADSLVAAISGENAGDECHVEQIRSLVCNAADNLGDMPVSDAWARKWCEQAAPIIAKWIIERRYPASPAPDKEG